MLLITFKRFYYVGRAVVEKVLNYNPYFVRVYAQDVLDILDMNIPFLEGDLVFLHHSPKRSIVWEASKFIPTRN